MTYIAHRCRHITEQWYAALCHYPLVCASTPVQGAGDLFLTFDVEVKNSRLMRLGECVQRLMNVQEANH